MSTHGQPALEPEWKQEVNRRLAAHKSRKSGSAAPSENKPAPSAIASRAGEAAARVAARYAAAPTYSEMQAQEARVAVRAAEIATQVALEAQAAAETVLAELHAASSEEPMRGPAVIESIVRAAAKEPAAQIIAQTPIEERAPAAATGTVVASQAPAAKRESEPIVVPELLEGKPFGIRWEADMPVRAVEMKPAPARQQETFEMAAEDWWTPAEVQATLKSEPIRVEPQQTHANLIHFPREIVATRKMRPRLAEATALGEAEAQLSIFEVDPRSVSTEAEPMERVGAKAAESLGRAEWSDIELDAHPAEMRAAHTDAAAAKEGLFLAPLGLRLMATAVDGALIACATTAAAIIAMTRMQHVPAAKPAEAMALGGLVLMGLLYHALFFSMARSTPGMSYAGIALCTFDNDSPNRAQLRRRLVAMVLSLLPVGLGVVWSVFDEDHLSWHDRFSQTYLRKR